MKIGNIRIRRKNWETATKGNSSSTVNAFAREFIEAYNEVRATRLGEDFSFEDLDLPVTVKFTGLTLNHIRTNLGLPDSNGRVTFSDHQNESDFTGIVVE